MSTLYAWTNSDKALTVYTIDETASNNRYYKADGTQYEAGEIPDSDYYYQDSCTYDATNNRIWVFGEH